MSNKMQCLDFSCNQSYILYIDITTYWVVVDCWYHVALKLSNVYVQTCSIIIEILFEKIYQTYYLQVFQCGR